MDEKTTLAKRLAAYSAAAGIALAAAPDASGQIIFHDIDPDIHFDTGGGGGPRSSTSNWTSTGMVPMTFNCTRAATT